MIKKCDSDYSINIPIAVNVFCTVIAEIIIFGYYIYKYSNGGIDMEGAWIAAVAAIVAAIIGAASGIWMQVVQFKKDRQHIDSVNDTSKNILNDTGHIRPEIDSMATDVKYLADNVRENVQENKRVQDSVAELLEAKRINDALRQAAQAGMPSVDRMQSYIESLYSANAKKDTLILDFEHEVLLLKQEKHNLENTITKRDDMIKSLQNEIQTLKAEEPEPET